MNKRLSKVFGILFLLLELIIVPEAIDLLLSIRQQAKQNKDWATSDKIRDALGALGVVVKDGKDGATWEIR